MIAGESCATRASQVKLSFANNTMPPDRDRH
jgi:hypothetical protein